MTAFLPRPRHLIAAAGATILLAAGTLATPAAETGAAPVKIAVFDLEFEDFSAAAGIAGDPARDLMYLDRATAAVRRTLDGSPHFELVDVAAATEPAAKDRTLRDCNGCEAAIARELGADQSFVGVVKRISRTEYTVRFVLRDTRTGKPLLVRQAFRMGADHSWDRGASALVTAALIKGS